jgi:LPXTG-motif cell wall-anchored protein
MATVRNQHPNNTAASISASSVLPGLFAAFALALLLMLSMGMGKAGAQTPTTYPPDTSTTVVQVTPGAPDDNIIEPTEPVHFHFSGFTPGTTVHLIVNVDTNGDGIPEPYTIDVIADADGNADFDWTVPAGTPAGDYTFSAEGVDAVSGDPRTATGSFHVSDTCAFLAGNNCSVTGNLPYTGSDSSTLLRVGAVLLVAGGISVVAVRRRNAHSNA